MRKAKRQLFNVTHPINTAENAALNAVTPSRRRRRAKGRADGARGTPPGSPQIAQSDAPGTDLPWAGLVGFTVFVVVFLVVGAALSAFVGPGLAWAVALFVGSMLARASYRRLSP